MFKKIQNHFRLRKVLKKEQKAEQKAHRDARKQAPTHFDHAVLEWYAPEYLQYHKGRTWFAIFGLIIVVTAYFAIKTNDYFFATAILTFGAVYLLTHRTKPKLVKVKLSRYGLKMGDQTYPFSQIKAFWLIYNPPFVETLNIRLNKKFMPDRAIHLYDQNPADIREFLASHIPEWQDRQETFSETLIRMLRL